MFTEPKRGWTGTITASAQLHALGAVSVAGRSVLVGNQLFTEPRHGWSGAIAPSATLRGQFAPTDEARSNALLVTASVEAAASGCLVPCPVPVRAISKPSTGWHGRAAGTPIVQTTSSTGLLPLALTGQDLFLTGGNSVLVYRLMG